MHWISRLGYRFGMLKRKNLGIEEELTHIDRSDFVESLCCTVAGEGQFTSMAVELDAGNRIFTTRPVMPVIEAMS